MGLHNGAYATVWSVEPGSDVRTKVRLSISRKNKNTGEYETDFSGFVNFCGTVAAKKAAGLKERDRIKIGDTDVTNRYDKEKNVTYVNYAVFDFSMASENNAEPQPPENIDNGEPDDSDLPF